MTLMRLLGMELHEAHAHINESFDSDYCIAIVEEDGLALVHHTHPQRRRRIEVKMSDGRIHAYSLLSVS